MVASYGMVAHTMRSKAWVERTLFSDPTGITVIFLLVFMGMVVVAVVCGIFNERVQLQKLALVNTLNYKHT
jgi:hypothetical protein